MRLITLELQGFMSYKDYNRIDFNLGVTGIIGSVNGDTKKSNGSGKSAIVLAILFVLYGEGNFSKIEEVWNDKLSTKDLVFVRLTFELATNMYIIERGRKSSGGNYLDVFENGKPNSSSVPENQEFIKRLLNMDHKLFTASIFFKQNDLDSLIGEDPAVRRTYLDSILNLEIWRIGFKNINDTIKTTEGNKNLFELKVTELEKTLKTISDDISIILKEIEKLSEFELERRIATEKLTTCADVISITESLLEYENLLNRKISEKDNLALKSAATISLMLDLKKELNILKDEQLELSLQNVEDYTIKISTLEQEIIELTTKIENVDFFVLQHTLAIEHFDADIDNMKTGILGFTKNICNQCARTVPESLSQTRIDFFNGQIENKRELIQQRKREIKSLKDSIVEHMNRKIEALREVKEVNFTLHNLDIKKKHNQEKITRCENDIIKNTAESSSLQIQFEQALASEKEYSQKLEYLKTKVTNESALNISLLKTRISELEPLITKLTLQKGRVILLQEKELSTRSDFENIKNRLKELDENLYYLNGIRQIFQDIPTNLFKESIIETEKYANEVIQSILPTFKTKIYEDEQKKNRPIVVSFDVSHKNRNYKLLSGGQQTVCAIGVRIGLNKNITKKANTRIGFLSLDEVLKFLDEENRALVLRAIASWTTLFPQILLITHTSEAESVPNVIRVNQDLLGTSYIVQ